MPGEPSTLATLPRLCSSCGISERTSAAALCTPSIASPELRITWLCLSISVEPSNDCTSPPSDCASSE
jgi:hypothetical protein